MKKQKLKHLKLYNNLYGVFLHIRIGGTEDEANKWSSKVLRGEPGYKTVKYYQNAGRFYYITEGMCFDSCIWFEKRPGAAMLAHELLHWTSHVLSGVGVGLMEHGKTEEAYCYLLQWGIMAIGNRIW